MLSKIIQEQHTIPFFRQRECNSQGFSNEKTAEPILNKADPNYQYEEYRRLLELYTEIDPGLTQRLATRALKSDIEDVREAGEDFILKQGDL